MHRWYLFRLGIAVTLLTLTFAIPTVSLAQSTIDLVVHYVEGIPAENDIAYQVSVYLSVVDSTGNPVKNLTSDALTVTEDSQKVAIENLSLGGEEPINIILVMDTSGSMSGAGITDAKTAASNFVAGMKSGDRVAIVTFDNTVKTQIDFTTDHQAVRNQISLIEAVRGAGTCMYDAAYQAVQMASTLPSGRRAVVLFTDGVDETPNGAVCSTHTTEDVISLGSEGSTRTPIYTLGMGNRLDTAGLKRLAEFTGGRYLYSPDSSQLGSLFLVLSDQLSSQYVLTYRSVSGPGAHTLAVSANYLNAQDSDTRNFLLPALPTRLNFSSPQEGEDVGDLLKMSVSLSKDGETVDRVAFEVDGKIVGTDDTSPYEAEIDLAGYPPGNLDVTAIAYGINDAELARKTIQVRVVTPVINTASAPSEPETPSSNNSNMGLIVGIGLGGLVLITLALVAYFVVRRSREEKIRDEEWSKAQSNESVAARTQDDERTVDSWEISSDALGMLTVEACDDSGMIGHRFEILKPLTTLGRSADNDINFPKDSPVSRHHAEISEKRGGLYLRELESVDSTGKSKPPTFGTFLNDVPLEADAVLLQPGDQIRLGKRVLLRFESSRRMVDPESVTYDGMMSSDDADKTYDQS